MRAKEREDRGECCEEMLAQGCLQYPDFHDAYPWRQSRSLCGNKHWSFKLTACSGLGVPRDGRLNWHPHGKGRFDAGGAGKVDGAAVGFDGATHDAEAEAGPFDLWTVVLVPSEEALEDKR